MRALILLSLTALGAATAAQAGAELGQKAAPLTGIEWIKGQPVDPARPDGKQVYVVEFWATWCGPCRRSIPHLTELQNKYKGRVTFVGISDEKPDVVRKFVQQWGEKMDYTVAADPGRKVYDAYMKAFGINGIPHAFVVDRKGRIVWHGHPLSGLDEVLEKVLAGKWDIEKARAEIERRDRAQRAMMQTLPLLSRYFALAADKSKAAEARKLGEQILKQGAPAPELLNQFAWQILTKDGLAVRDVKLALRAAKMANDATGGQDAAILDTLALALFENGQKTEAVKVQSKAVRLAKTDPRYKSVIGELTERLKRYRDQTP